MFKKVKTLLSERTRWCKGTMARNKYRHAVKVDSDSACKFCLVGAVNRIYGQSYSETIPVKKKLADSIRSLFPRTHGYNDESTIINFNDDSNVTYEDVKKVIRHANV